MDGIGQAAALNLAVWSGGGLLLGGLGISVVIEGAGGVFGVLAWLMIGVGFGLSVIAAVMLGLAWRNGRPATLTRDGVDIPGRLTSVRVPWSHVEQCEVRPAAKGDRLLLARFKRQRAASMGSESVFLGKIPPTVSSEEDLVARVDSWIARGT